MIAPSTWPDCDSVSVPAKCTPQSTVESHTQSVRNSPRNHCRNGRLLVLLAPLNRRNGVSAFVMCSNSCRSWTDICKPLEECARAHKVPFDGTRLRHIRGRSLRDATRCQVPTPRNVSVIKRPKPGSH
jgi:hypothetical protein